MVLSYADMNDQQRKKYMKRVKREYGDRKVRDSGPTVSIYTRAEWLLKIELNSRAQCKNEIKFPFSVTVSKFSPYILLHSAFPLWWCVVATGARTSSPKKLLIKFS